MYQNQKLSCIKISKENIDSIQIQFRQMVGEQLTKQQQKTNSAEGDISTSQSTQSRQKNKLLIDFQHQFLADQSNIIKVSFPCQIKSIPQQKLQDEHQNRLFTFMDQKDCQKKFIQDYLQMRTNKLSSFNYQSKKQNNFKRTSQLKIEVGLPLQISKKKYENFSKKSIDTNSKSKSIKSVSNLSKINKSKTPKANFQKLTKIQAAGDKNVSKTPKMVQARNITPKYQKQDKFFRSNSQIEHNLEFIPIEISTKKSFKQINPKIERFQFVEQTKLALMKKKKKLESELAAINQSLQSQKKKFKDQKGVINKKKSNIAGDKKNRKKSTIKLFKLN